MSNQLTTTTPEALKAYQEKLHQQANQVAPAKYNQIKICYDDEKPELKGLYISRKEGETEWKTIGESFKGIILANRSQYSYYHKTNKEEFMRTEQFEDFQPIVHVVYDGLQDDVKGIANWVKERYPKDGAKKAKFQAILYVLFEGDVYLFRVGGTSCAPFFALRKALDTRDLMFSSICEFGRQKAKSPEGKIYWPSTFKWLEKTDEKQFNENLVRSYEVDQMIKVLNNGGKQANPNATEEEIEASITPEDLPFKDTKAEAEEAEKKKFLEAVK